MKTLKMKVAQATGAFLALIVLALPTQTLAANITWGTPTVNTGNAGTDVSTNGIYVDALTLGPQVNNSTINGVVFNASQYVYQFGNYNYSTDIKVHYDASAGNSSGTTYADLLQSYIYTGNDANYTIALSGLTASHHYQVEIWGANTGLSSGNTATLSSGGVKYVLGTFLAGGTSQNITYNTSSGQSVVNAVSLRALVANIGGIAVSPTAGSIIIGGNTAFTFSVTNTAVANSDNLNATATAGTGVSGSVSVTQNLAPGSGQSGISGFTFTGTTVGANQNGTFTMSDSYALVVPKTNTVTVNVFDHAKPSLTNSYTVTLANQHVGYSSPVTSGSLSATNGSASDYRVNLKSSAVTNGNLSLNALSAITAGGIGAVQATLATGQTAGSVSNQFTYTFADDSALNGASANLGAATIIVTGGVYRLATANTFGTTVNLGNIHVGGSFGTQALNVSNAVVNDNYSEKLNAAFGTPGSGVSTNGTVSLLTPGSSSSALTVGISDNTAGSKSGTVAVNLVSDGNGSSGLGTTALGSQTVTVQGNVYTGIGVWNANASGSWIGTANWTADGGVPGVDGNLSTFDAATFSNALTSAVAVNLDGTSPTLSGLTFSNANHSYTIAQGTGGALILTNAPSVIVAAGNHTISASVQLAGNAQMTVSNATDQLTVSGAISGNGFGLTKAGAGTLVFNGTNTYSGATTISNGTLRVDGMISGIGNVAVANGGTLTGTGTITALVVNQGRVDFGGTVSNNFTQTGGSFTLSGNATISGNAMVGGGAVNLQGNRLSSGLLVVSGAGVFTNAVAGGTVNGGVSNAATVAVTANTFFNGPVTNTGVFVFRGAVSNSVANSGSVTVNNNATFTGLLANSGSLTVTNGTLSLLTAPTQNGTITVNSGGTLTVTPAWQNAGTLDVMGGTVNGGNLTNVFGATIRNSGTISSLLVNFGTLEALGGAGLTVNGTTNAFGSAIVISNSTLTTSGLLRNAGNVTLLNSAGTLLAGAVNTGTLIVTNTLSGSAAQLTASGAFVNTGTINFFHSAGTFNGTVVNSGYWISDPTTNVYESTFTNDTAGVISMAAGDVYIFRTNSTGGATVGSFVDISTNNVANDKLGGKFLFENTTLALTQNLYAAGHDMNQANAITPTNQITLTSLSPLPAGYFTNFSLGTLEIANSTTVRVWDAFIDGGPGTNDNLRAALYVTNLLMGADSFLIISSNVSVYFLTSNTWGAANFTLLGGPVLSNRGQLHQFIAGEVTLSVIPEPSVLLLWVSGAITVYAARRRAGKRGASSS